MTIGFSGGWRRQAIRRLAHLVLMATFGLLCGASLPGLLAQDQPDANVSPKPTSGSEGERKYPSLPGAVDSPPKWVVRDAPFDVVAYFKPVAPEENAALLYLDALYDFSPGDMQNCISPAEHALRGPATSELATRAGKLMLAKPENVSPLDRALIVAEYADSFDKLARAQRRPHCLFETGIGLTALLPHAQSSRQVIRLLDWRVEVRIAGKNVQGALDDIAMGLRLSRDLRPRGCAISQLVSIALDAVITSSLIPKVLAAPGLTLKQCDRLLEIVTRHAADGPDSLAEASRMEYLMCRDVLHQLEYKLDPQIVTEFSGPSKIALESMTRADYAAEVELLNEYFRPFIAAGARPIHGPYRLSAAQDMAQSKMKIGREMVASWPQILEACRRHRTRISATRCLIALRRWKLKSKNANPPDLQVLCKDEGIGEVPVDEYSESGEPLRSTVIAGDFVIYSVGLDGKDDGARADWEFGKQPGDWVFRLPPKP